jgi:hypothetical protein
MHVKEIYVISIHLLDSGILLIIDLSKKKGEKGGNLFVNFTVKEMLCFDSLKRKVRSCVFISNFHHSLPPPPKGYKIVSLIIN